MNSITLIGRLGIDPDVKYFAETGTNVAKFSLAVNRARRNGNGEKVTDWFNCECWNKTAEIAANYCRKGKQIAVCGSIEFEHWQDKNTGEKRSRPVVRVNNLELLGSSQGTSDEESSSGSQQKQVSRLVPQVSRTVPVDEDDIPY